MKKALVGFAGGVLVGVLLPLAFRPEPEIRETKKIVLVAADPPDTSTQDIESPLEIVGALEKATDPGKRSELITKLGRFGGGARDHLIQFCMEGSTTDRLTALRVMGDVGEDADVALFLSLLPREADKEVKRALVQSSARIRRRSVTRERRLRDRVLTDYAPHLRPLLDTPMKDDAMVVLASVGDVEVAGKLAEALLAASPEEEVVRERVVEALGFYRSFSFTAEEEEILRRKVRDPLTNALEAEELSPETRKAVVQILSSFGWII